MEFTDTINPMGRKPAPGKASAGTVPRASR
jgi:hypothetical protein